MWLFFAPIFVAIISILISVYRTRKRFPPGPIPLPIIGNLLSFVADEDVMKVIRHYTKIYGPVCTFWFGNKPHVVISDWHLIKEVLRRSNFQHRPPTVLSERLLPHGSDVFISSPSPEYNVLRRTITTSLRIYLNDNNMEKVIHDVFSQKIEDQLSSGEAFDGQEFAKSAIMSVMSEVTFTPKNETESKEALVIFERVLKLFNDLAGNGCLSDYLPLFRPFFLRKEREIEKVVAECSTFLKQKCVKRHQNVEMGRDFVGALLTARNETSEDERKYLHEDNLSYLLIDLFFGGTDSSLISLSWAMLFLAKYPQYQEKIQAEIAAQMGDRSPEKDDLKRCDYTMAFMLDLWRLRVVASFLLPHYNKEPVTLGNHRLPSGTSILCDIGAIQSDPKYWPNPDQLIPERYLDENGKLANARPDHYATFGMGNRACPGEKFAKFELFLALTTLMQKCNLVLESRVDNVLNRKLIAVTCEPKPYKIRFIRRIESTSN